MTSIGIDVSGVQADAVPGDWAFVVVKSSEGTSFPNHRLDAQWANAGHAPARGLYHYARPGKSSGGAQAAVFVADALARGFRPGRDIFQLDCENGENEGVDSATWRTFIGDFMGLAQAKLGGRSFLYAGWPFVVEHGIGDFLFKYKWWLPDYGRNTAPVNNGFNDVPANVRPLVIIHQFTSAGGLDLNQIVNPFVFGGTPVPNPAPQPTPVPVQKVKPMYSPALTIHVAAALYVPAAKTFYQVQPDGALFCFGPKQVRGLNGNPNFVGREAAQLELVTPAEKTAGKTLAIIDTAKERYAL